MTLKKNGETYITENKAFTIGGSVLANDNSDYCGLRGRITEIRDGDDKETENEGVDIYCDFDIPGKAHMIAEIETRFSKLYQMPKHIDELPLGGVIMAPEMLEPVADKLPESGERLYALAYYRDSDAENVSGALAVSNDRAMLVRKMLDDLDARNMKAVLAHSQEDEDGSEYVFEPSNITTEDFYIGYSIFKVPVYRSEKGGAAA